MVKDDCPQQDELNQFNNGQLPSEQVSKIGKHVEECDDCANTLNLLGETSDTLVARLRSEKTSEQCSEDDRIRVVKLAGQVREQVPAEKPSPTQLEIPPELKKVATDVIKTGLLTKEKVGEAIAALPAAKRSDLQEFVKSLIRSKQLTKFQGTAVYGGKAKSLVFGEYVVLDKIGQGGMGMVYRARHKRMKREVAVKVLPGGSLDNDDAITRFYREVEAAAKLIHTNIVTAFDAGEHGKSHYLVMEFVDGKDLSGILKKNGRFPVAVAVELIIQAAMGLEYAHKKGLTHRDIKPANMLLDQEGTVKILDMGLARLSVAGVSDDGLTKSGQIMGTVDYMAPEQATDTRSADSRADVYSLGCTLHRLLVNQPIYEGETIMNKMMAHAQTTAPDLTLLREDVSSQLNDVFQKMVAKSPADRFQSMTEVIAALRACPIDDAAAHSSSSLLSGVSVPDGNSESQLTEFLDKVPTPVASSGEQTTAVIEQTIEIHNTGQFETTITEANLKPQPAPQKQNSRRGLLVGLIAGLAALLVAGVVFYVNIGGKYDVKITVEDPSISLKVDGDDVLIEGAGSQIRLSAGPHTLRMEREGLEAELKEFTVKKKGQNLVHVTVVEGRLSLFEDGKKPPVQPADPVKPTTPSISSSQEFALQFDGDGFVEIPTLKFDNSHPLTVEAVLSVDEFPKESTDQFTILSDSRGRGLRLSCRGKELFDFGVDEGRTMYHAVGRGDQNNGAIEASQLKTTVHVCGTFDGKFVSLFLNGKFVRASRELPYDPIVFKGQFEKWFIGKDPLLKGSGFRGRVSQLKLSRIVRYEEDYNPVAKLTADNDTIALYHFDEGQGDVLKDSSGNDHHGKIFEAKWVPTDSMVVPGYALHFDGSSEDQFLATLKEQEPFSDQTLEAWITHEGPRVATVALEAYGGEGVITRVEHLGREGWHAYRYHFGTHNGSPYSDGDSRDRTHVAIVQSAGKLSVFVDGKLKAAKTFQKEPVQYTGLVVGRKLGNHRFVGVMDEIRFSRVARYTADFDPAERLETDDRTVALYHFDEGSGDIAKDSSGNGYHAKLKGVKWVRSRESRSPSTPPTTTARPRSEIVPSETVVTSKSGRPSLRFDRESAQQPPVLVKSLKKAFEDLKPQSVTFECRVRCRDIADGEVILGQKYNVGIERGRGKLRAFVYRNFTIDGSSGSIVHTELGECWTEQWVHLAAVADGSKSELRFYIAGKLVQPATPIGPIKDAWSNLTDFRIGHRFSGDIDWVRVSDTARYTSDFVPQFPREADEKTLALYNFDEGSGNVLKDSSGNNHHGEIVGAKWLRIGEMDSALRTAPAGATKASESSPANNYALQFDGAGKVDLGKLDFDFDNPLTVEAWITPGDPSDGFQTVLGAGKPFDSTVNNFILARRWRESSKVGGWTFELAPKEFGLAYSTEPFQATDNKPLHLVGVWDGKRSRLYINGKYIGRQKENVNPEKDQKRTSQPVNWIIGAASSEGYSFKGTIDELRISNNIRYTQDFTPPTSEDRYSPDEHTLALYHFDEGNGDVLNDSSGNNHHGKITGAKWIRQDGLKSADRKAAEWIIRNRGSASIKVGDETVELSTIERLPTDPFTLVRVNLSRLQTLKRIELAGATNIQHLDLHSVRVGPEAIPQIKAMTRLELLRLPHDETNRWVEAISDHKALRELSLYRTSFSDEGAKHLGKITELTSLTLAQSKISAAALVDIKGLTKLNYLNLHGTKITDDSLQNLKDMKTLETLLLIDTPITDKGLIHLYGLKSLKKLNIEGLNISQMAIQAFRKAVPKCSVNGP